MYVAAKEAGLKIEAPTRHDFAKIPDVEKKDGVSIYVSPYEQTSSSLQNLYITNNKIKPIALVISHDKEKVDITVEQLN